MANESSYDWRQESLEALLAAQARYEKTHNLKAEFAEWQGKIVATLAFNPSLQETFRSTALEYVGLWGSSENARKASIIKQKLAAILAQAIHELKTPTAVSRIDQSSVEKPSTPTEEQSLPWFVMHCHWKTKIQLFGAAVTVFGLGFFGGQNDRIARAWDALTSEESTAPQNTNTENNPTTKETDKKREERISQPDETKEEKSIPATTTKQE